MLRKSILSLLVPAFFAGFISLLLNKYAILPSTNWPASLIFYVSIGTIFRVVYLLSRTSKDFTQVLLVSIVLKLLICLIFIVFFSFGDKKVFFNFAIHFIIHFIFFTIFEIRYILALVRITSKHTKP
jgi:hypothetical protein